MFVKPVDASGGCPLTRFLVILLWNSTLISNISIVFNVVYLAVELV
jgi:hypothetical protein